MSLISRVNRALRLFKDPYYYHRAALETEVKWSTEQLNEKDIKIECLRKQYMDLVRRVEGSTAATKELFEQLHGENSWFKTDSPYIILNDKSEYVWVATTNSRIYHLYMATGAVHPGNSEIWKKVNIW